ncbi:hypothetical protein F2Q69_00059866 [Brassica cretica]|uniref:Uncharacterized protein n=1 Tax=Brassica cretica TaxID=69181 RepID=A0A8S9RHP7_BRACR|nr:hypothetical protein F2Q69_00059866 [Brassica cretica]
MAYEEVINELNLKDTELRLGLPGTDEQAEVSCFKSNKLLVLLFFTLITDHPPPRLPSNLISQ